ncbi:MAG: RICIN domain-containing protein, partial [Anaerolineae bacterium]|nr:RICIN domain-containing protein [Anaerolineae bacterium]
FRFEATADGYYIITAKHSGKALDVNEGSTADGKTIIQWDIHRAANQQFKLEPAGDGYYFIVARHSGKVWDVNGNSPSQQRGHHPMDADHAGQPGALDIPLHGGSEHSHGSGVGSPAGAPSGGPVDGPLVDVRAHLRVGCYPLCLSPAYSTGQPAAGCSPGRCPFWGNAAARLFHRRSANLAR